MFGHQINYRWLCVFCLLIIMGSADASAVLPPKKKHTRIELVYDVPARMTSMGETKFFTVVPYSYFYLRDIYTDEERKVGSEAFRDNVTALDFELSHPLYDEIVPGSTSRIPFYIEPGDTLQVFVTRTGRVIDYARKDGGRVECENLLRHDISNCTFYTARDFEADRKDVDFGRFVARITKKMNTVVDSVRSIADKYGFSEKERRIAVNNVKLQFALWIFEYAPYKSAEIGAYSSKHEEGWQTLPNQDRDAGSITDISNYAFINDMPLSDSTSLVSKYFPMYIKNYEHSRILNSDQYLYYGTSDEDIARMDSAFAARELMITGRMQNSLFMDIALQRRHIETTPDDGSIKLQEVQVLGRRSNDYFPGITEADMINARLNSKTTYNALSPSYWLYGRKREKTRARVREILKKDREEDERKQQEHDEIMRAYEETQREMKAKEVKKQLDE